MRENLVIRLRMELNGYNIKGRNALRLSVPMNKTETERRDNNGYLGFIYRRNASPNKDGVGKE